MRHRGEYVQKNIIVFRFRHFHLYYPRLTLLSLLIKKKKRRIKESHRRRPHYYYSIFILFIRRTPHYRYSIFILFIRRLFHYRYPILILAKIEIYVFQKTSITRPMISLSLFEDHLIIIILRSIYYRYLTLISLSLSDFDSHKNRNSCFAKTPSLCARELHYYYSMLIIRPTISLSLFDVYFNYSTLISLLLSDFDFHENSNSCFSYIFIMRSIVSLLLFDNHLTYSTLDV